MLKGGRRSNLTFNSAKVRKPLLAVSEVSDRGNASLFSPDGAWILPMTPEFRRKLMALVAEVTGKVELVRAGGIYHLLAWLILVVETTSAFARPETSN